MMIKSVNEQILKQSKLLLPKVKRVNISSLRYLPKQLSTDVFEISKLESGNRLLTKENLEKFINSGKTQTQIAEELGVPRTTLVFYLKKFGLYSQTKNPSTPDVIIDIEKLQSLVNEEKTLNELATELNVSVGKVRYYLKKYGITTDSRDEIKVVKKYIYAKTDKDRVSATLEVDKYLKQIAKDTYQPNNTTTFDDYLQDVRLSFFDLANQKLDGRRDEKVMGNLFDKVRESMPLLEDEITHCNLSFAEDIIDESAIFVETLENSDFVEFITRKANLSKIDEYIVNALVKEDKTLDKVSKETQLNLNTIIRRFGLALQKFEKIAKRITSEEHFNKRSEIVREAMKIVMESSNC